MAKSKTVSPEEAFSLLKQREEIKQQLTGPVLQQALLASLKPIFEANPQLQTISWDQLSPSFADGDISEFYVGVEDVQLESDAKDEVDFPKETYDAVAEVLGLFSEDDFDLMFGGDTTVIINRRGKVKQKDTY